MCSHSLKNCANQITNCIRSMHASARWDQVSTVATDMLSLRGKYQRTVGIKCFYYLFTYHGDSLSWLVYLLLTTFIEQWIRHFGTQRSIASCPQHTIILLECWKEPLAESSEDSCKRWCQWRRHSSLSEVNIRLFLGNQITHSPPLQPAALPDTFCRILLNCKWSN